MTELSPQMTVSQRLSEFKLFANRFIGISCDSTEPKIGEPDIGLFRVYLLTVNEEVMGQFDIKAEELGAVSLRGWEINESSFLNLYPKCIAENVYMLKK